MRSFITASLILLTMIGLIIWNSFWVTNKIDDLLDICDEIENGSPVLEKLLSGWQDCRDILALSINHSEIDRAESALCDLVSYAVGSDDFISKLREFKSALTHISDAQKLTLDNIL